jgi:hypothetical protein
MEILELGKKQKKSLPPLERDALVKKMRGEDDKIVTGVFEFLDAVGGFFEFSYRKYPGESIKIVKLIHGETCDLMAGMMRQLNNSVQKIRRYDMNMPWDGKKPIRTYTTKSRVRFTPTGAF